MLSIFIDADACPVKQEALKVADRHQLHIYFVANTWLRLNTHGRVHRIVVDDGADAADDWIADHVTPGDIVVTADIPLAARCLERHAHVIGPTGKPFTNESIGMALAMRDLSQHLRETGESKGYNAAFTKRDRSRFLEALEQAVQSSLRSHQN